jgi:translation initiation factor 3 subunit G
VYRQLTNFQLDCIRTSLLYCISTRANHLGRQQLYQIKTTTKYRIREVRNRVPKRVAARKNLPRFGDARAGEENVTLTSKDLIFMEHPDDQLTEDIDDPTLAKTLANFILKQQETKLARDSDVDGMMFNEDGDMVNQGDDGAKTDRYVAPGARAGASTATMGGSSLDNAFKDQAKDREAENTIRVSNLTKMATEDDLRELFEPFGRVFRISLPRAERIDSSGKMVKEPRGFAYIAFVNKQDAEKAMDRLQGYGYDHLLLKLEWAQATKKDNTGAPPGDNSMRFASGYGKQLAQDTKEKVVYASNLTGNSGSWGAK